MMENQMEKKNAKKMEQSLGMRIVTMQSILHLSDDPR